MNRRLTRWLQINSSVLIASSFALALFAINEISYWRVMAINADLSAAIEARIELQKLTRLLIDAETSQRGYLLTGESEDLRPYQESRVAIAASMNAIRQRYLHDLNFVADFEGLATAIAKKQEEMSLTVALRSGGNDAWKTIVATNSGRVQMNGIRERSDHMRDRETQRVEYYRRSFQQTQWWVRIANIIIVIGGLTAFVFYSRQARLLVREREQQQRQLQRDHDLLEAQIQERTRRLSELALHLLNVREDERARLARELHDELGALLVAAKLDLARLKARLTDANEYIKERLLHLGQALNNGISLKRRIIEELHPSSLSKLGLVAALDILVREFSTRTNLQCTCSLEPVNLTPAADLTVYRLVQEALTNIVKHAGASKIEVKLMKQPQQAAIEVRDNGRGFDPALTAASSHGLEGMRYRVVASGGSMQVHSAVGEGTLITATLPLVRNVS
jgi:signal transduction histidine kinase